MAYAPETYQINVLIASCHKMPLKTVGFAISFVESDHNFGNAEWQYGSYSN